MTTVASDPVPPAEGAAAATSKSKKGKVLKEKKPRAPPSHLPYAEVCSFPSKSKLDLNESNPSKRNSDTSSLYCIYVFRKVSTDLCAI